MNTSPLDVCGFYVFILGMVIALILVIARQHYIFYPD